MGVSRLSPLNCPRCGLLGRGLSHVDSHRMTASLSKNAQGPREGQSGKVCLCVGPMGVVAAVLAVTIGPHHGWALRALCCLKSDRERQILYDLTSSGI